MAEKPLLSVVVVTLVDFSYVRRTVEHLRTQTIVQQIELIVVAPKKADITDAREDELADFASVNVYETSEAIENADEAAAPALLIAQADIVAIVEDHAFPEPAWAQAILDAHKGDWAMVGSAVINANPGSGLSWANQFMAYGRYSEPIVGGQMSMVSRHNASFKKHVINGYSDRLADLFVRGGGLIETLSEDGHKLYLSEDARIHHLNPSNFASTTQLRFFSGRLAAASLADRQGWSYLRRLAYLVLWPVLPAKRFKRIVNKVFAPLQRNRLHRLLPALTYALTLDALGQVIGFLTGPGQAAQRLARFEYDRLRHLNHKDRANYSQPLNPSSSISSTAMPEQDADQRSAEQLQHS